MGKTTMLKAELGQSKSSSPAVSAAAGVPNSYEMWQQQQAKLKKELDAKVERQKSIEREKDLRNKLKNENSAKKERREREEAEKRAKQQAHDK